jgi:hypothetical protein
VAVKVNFDPKALQATNVSAGTFLPVVLVPGTGGSGVASITLGASPGNTKTGSGVLATITFRALKATSTTSISFDKANTQVSVIGQTGNQVGSLSSANVSLGQTAPGAEK